MEINKEYLPPPQIPTAIVFVLLFLIMIFSSLIGTAFMYGFSALKGIDFQGFISGAIEIKAAGERNAIRFIIMLNHLFTFVIPAVAFNWMFKRNRWPKQLTLHKNVNTTILDAVETDISQLAPASLGKGTTITNLLVGSLLILAAFPLAQYSFAIFQDAAWLPEWMRSMEDSTETMIKSLLQVDSIFELLFNILVIAMIPAIGEEFIFRGIIQKQLQFTINPHAAIWLAAILFSAIHLQFEGFVARMILGALLGYLYYFSGSIWVAVFAHFVNNAVQVLVSYFWADELLGTDITEPEQVPFTMAIVSLILVIIIWNFLRNHNASARRMES